MKEKGYNIREGEYCVVVVKRDNRGEKRGYLHQAKSLSEKEVESWTQQVYLSIRMT